MPRQSTPLNLATPERIAEQALLIVDQDGHTALSFRTLATALGISVASLQRRCTDLAGLLDLVTDHLAAQLPDIDSATDWPTATTRRFTALYELLTAHPGLVALRGGRPWLGPQLLKRLVEPQLAHSITAGMTPEDAIVTYRRLYLLTLGSASFVDHRHPAAAQATTRRALAALDPAQFPTLTGHLAAILPAVVDHEIYHGALRQLIDAADPNRH
ncbi:TetR/AcrR family transcriptional regulator [Streptomyces yaizuensis]|uniref:TetR/AcrR family transcriptional regulator C-terminal domain-containing protein n=1 Tax=Streptomyces yaizuensis TaxID=2989713 RepID=A0ABQ5NYD8_9ACTN|nr:TetR/AcrR family transcriptional regulator C-terminal domain-containing protein [Streptomyces sp. YSPA8]GLF95242.1 TetR/AcrR family transcriptional regulator C-terminal domain-containing protein [Streptomyces sp. YSPA8]